MCINKVSPQIILRKGSQASSKTCHDNVDDVNFRQTGRVKKADETIYSKSNSSVVAHLR